MVSTEAPRSALGAAMFGVTNAFQIGGQSCMTAVVSVEDALHLPVTKQSKNDSD